MSASASQIAKRSAALDAEIAAMAETVSAAEKAVADAYAEGLDAAKALDKLARLRDSQRGQIAAASQLDEAWFNTATAEYESATAEVSARMEAGFAEAERAIRKGFSGVEVIFKKYAPTLSRIIEEQADAVCSRVWSEVFVLAWDGEAKAVGLRPVKRLPRDAAGQPVAPKFDYRF